MAIAGAEQVLDRAPLEGVAESWLSRSARSGRHARQVLAGLLERVDGGERFGESGPVVVAELLSNALKHGTRPGQRIFLHLEVNAIRLLVEVHDASTTEPVLRAVAPSEESGRGLQLVSSLAQSWGSRPRTPGIGKVVWAVVPPARRSC